MDNSLAQVSDLVDDLDLIFANTILRREMLRGYVIGMGSGPNERCFDYDLSRPLHTRQFSHSVTHSDNLGTGPSYAEGCKPWGITPDLGSGSQPGHAFPKYDDIDLMPGVDIEQAVRVRAVKAFVFTNGEVTANIARVFIPSQINNEANVGSQRYSEYLKALMGATSQVLTAQVNFCLIPWVAGVIVGDEFATASFPTTQEERLKFWHRHLTQDLSILEGSASARAANRDTLVVQGYGCREKASSPFFGQSVGLRLGNSQPSVARGENGLPRKSA